MNRNSGYKILETDKLRTLPVFDIDVEKSVLYCLLHSKEARENINKITKEDFFNNNNSWLFEKLEKHFKNKDFNVTTIPSEVKTNKAYLQLFNENYLLSYFDIYLSQLKTLTAKREIEKICYETTIKIKEDNELSEIKSRVIKQIENVNIELDKNITDVKQVDLGLEEYYRNINKEIIGTGFGVLDKFINGFQKGSFCVIGGVPGVGKTTLVLNMVNNICNKNYNVLFVSLEMPYREVEGKLISEMTNISTTRIRMIEYEKDEKIIEKIAEAREKIYNYHLYFIGMEGAYTYEIDDAIKNIGNIDIVFVDYLQRVRTKEGTNRYEKISAISGELKQLALKYDIPFVVVTSVNRAYVSRVSKEPQLSDLRESGNIEFDADIVLLLYREAQFDEEISKEKASLILAKNRYGISNTKIDLFFKPEKSRFYGGSHEEEGKRKDIFD